MVRLCVGQVHVCMGGEGVHKVCGPQATRTRTQTHRRAHVLKFGNMEMYLFFTQESFGAIDWVMQLH